MFRGCYWVLILVFATPVPAVEITIDSQPEAAPRPTLDDVTSPPAEVVQPHPTHSTESQAEETQPVGDQAVTKTPSPDEASTGPQISATAIAIGIGVAAAIAAAASGGSSSTTQH